MQITQRCDIYHYKIQQDLAHIKLQIIMVLVQIALGLKVILQAKLLGLPTTAKVEPMVYLFSG